MLGSLCSYRCKHRVQRAVPYTTELSIWPRRSANDRRPVNMWRVENDVVHVALSPVAVTDTACRRVHVSRGHLTWHLNQTQNRNSKEETKSNTRNDPIDEWSTAPDFSPKDTELSNGGVTRRRATTIRFFVSFLHRRQPNERGCSSRAARRWWLWRWTWRWRWRWT